MQSQKKSKGLTFRQVQRELHISAREVDQLVAAGDILYVDEQSDQRLLERSSVSKYRHRRNVRHARNHESLVVGVLTDGYLDKDQFVGPLQRMGRIERIHVYFDVRDAMLDGFYRASSFPNMRLKGAESITGARLILIDEYGQQLWSKCGTSGYSGTGPYQAMELLEWLSTVHDMPAIAAADLQSLLHHRVVTYVRNQTDWSVYAQDSLFQPAAVKPSQYQPNMDLIRYKGRLVLLQKSIHGDQSVEAQVILQQYRAFLPRPVKYFYLSEDRAPRFTTRGAREAVGYGVTHEYRLIIRDISGRELWLSLDPYETAAERTQILQQLLQAADLDGPYPQEREHGLIRQLFSSIKLAKSEK